LAYDGPDGSLIVSQVGTQRAGNALTEGVNAERLTAHLTGERYSKVVAFTQSVFLNAQGAPFLSFKQESKDAGVPRNRLLMVMVDALGPDGKYPQQLADWMVARNYGRSRQVQITVSGFRDRNGDLWAVNKVVSILAPSLKVSEDMIIAEVEFILDDQMGSRTVLTCMPAAGLQPPPFLFRPPFAFDPQTTSTAAAAERAVATGVTT
jgi:prophage tail gpP-like protein